MQHLNNTFPGTYKQARAKDYQYFLVGNIYDSQQLILDFALYKQMEEASWALGKFAFSIEQIPNPTAYVSAYSKKEATQSSRIEGTQTSIEDAYTKEQDVVLEERDSWQELHSTIKALDFAVEELEKLPLCNRLLKGTHRILLSHVKAKNKLPGEFRRSQNWIGGSRPSNAHFVPPAHRFIAEAMGNLEQFIQDDTVPIPHLIKAALIHYQFETIHPFLDGNGRIGRMLISLYLLEKKVIEHPILYVSNFFEMHRRNYYDALDGARQSQTNVVKWISFFLDAIYQTAAEGISKTKKILGLQNEIRDQKILTLGKRAKNARRLLELLFEQPILNAATVKERLAVSPQLAQTLLADFSALGILRETTGHRRNRIFKFAEYLALLEQSEEVDIGR